MSTAARLILILALAVPLAAAGCGGSDFTPEGESAGDSAGEIDRDTAVRNAREFCSAVTWQKLADEYGGSTREEAAQAYARTSYVEVQDDVYNACLETLK